MLEFLEEPRFNTEIRYGTVGGPEFNTDVSVVTSGAEYRNANWLDARGQWQVGDDVFNKAEIEALTGFFRERMGRAGGFRFKDWADFETTYPTLLKPDLPINGGFIQLEGFLQMVKLYPVGTNRIAYRIITKPVPGTVTLHGVSGTIDYTTGRIVGTGGVDPLTFDGTAFSTAMAWEGEFDVPARFDTDKFTAVFEGFREVDGERLFTVNGLTIVELRPVYPVAAVTP